MIERLVRERWVGFVGLKSPTMPIKALTSTAILACVLEVARKAGHLPLGTFDRELGKLDGVQRL